MKIAREELLRLLKSGCAVTPHQIQAAERIEELERDEIPIEIGEDGQPTNLHIFTDEQIDAAWATLNHCPIRSVEFRTLKIALSKLNIHRCEGCGGKGYDKKYGCWSLRGVAWGGRFDLSCPDCNGHGWVIGGDDE